MDFDSAIPRFESWRPSQPVRSLRCDFQVWENRRHSRGLTGNGRVFGEENRGLPTEGAFSWTSLCCMNFQYPEFRSACEIGLFCLTMAVDSLATLVQGGKRMAKKTKLRPWTKEDVRILKTLAREKTKTTVIARKLKRSYTATRQKASSLGVTLGTGRARGA